MHYIPANVSIIKTLIKDYFSVLLFVRIEVTFSMAQGRKYSSYAAQLGNAPSTILACKISYVTQGK